MSTQEIREMLTTYRGRQPLQLPKFSSWGCYPLMYVTEQGEALCAACATTALKDTDNDPPVACDANWENPSLHCDACGERIESAYAEDQS